MEENAQKLQRFNRTRMRDRWDQQVNNCVRINAHIMRIVIVTGERRNCKDGVNKETVDHECKRMHK